MRRLIKNLFLKNWGLKLFSFLIALVLWLTLIPPEKTFSEKTITVPLVLHNTPSEMEIVEKPPATVDVTIRAPNRLLVQITSATVHAALDLKNARVDVENYSLSKSMITIPEGAEVKDILPGQVKLKLERTKEILLDVEANLTGEMQKGYKLVKIEILPPQVLIKGPESKVKDKYKVRTSPIDISSLTHPIELEADLILPNSDLRLASSETKVIVRIIIQEENPEEKENKKKKK